jgi:mono/diheme cytochrome c family protein
MRQRLRAGWLTSLVLLPFLAQSAIAGEGGGGALYDANCALCHQRGGGGLAGQFPRLAGRVDKLAADTRTRHYLLEVLLFGMAGRVVVDDAPIMGVMPSFNTLSDQEIAAVLTHLARLAPGAKSIRSITASEVEAVRKGPHLSAGQVHADRKALADANAMP